MTPLPFKWQYLGRSVDTLLWWTGELSPLFGSESKCNVRFSSRGDFNQLPELGKTLLFHYLLNSTKFNLTLGRLTSIQSSSQWLVSHIALMMASGAPLMWSCLFTETLLQARFASAQQNSEKMVCGLTALQPTCCPKCCLWSFSPAVALASCCFSAGSAAAFHTRSSPQENTGSPLYAFRWQQNSFPLPGYLCKTLYCGKSLLLFLRSDFT